MREKNVFKDTSLLHPHFTAKDVKIWIGNWRKQSLLSNERTWDTTFHNELATCRPWEGARMTATPVDHETLVSTAGDICPLLDI